MNRPGMLHCVREDWGYCDLASAQSTYCQQHQIRLKTTEVAAPLLNGGEIRTVLLAMNTDRQEWTRVAKICTAELRRQATLLQYEQMHK